MPLSPIERERLDVAEVALNRLTALYKAKLRRGRDLERLRHFEQACNLLAMARLT